MKKFSHVDSEGKTNMVDVGYKKPQKRIARASGIISLSEETLRLIKENELKKGDVLSISQIAGIQAAKQTSNLIPLCHSLILDKVDVALSLTQNGIKAESTVKCIGRTGAEMEALTAVSAALLTVYDMCKAADTQMRINEIKLIEKVKEDV